jgi:heptosyltransferase-2
MPSPLPHLAVLRFSSAGDVLLTLPAVVALKAAWPTCTVHCLTRPAYAALLQGQPGVDEVVCLPPGSGWGGLQAALRGLGEAADRVAAGDAVAEPGQPSWGVLDLHGRLYSRAMRWRFGKRPWICWEKRAWARAAAFYLGDGRAQAPQHIVGRYHAAVEDLVGGPLPRQPLRFVVPPAAAQAARRLLPPAGRRPPVALSPGAMWATKRWPVQRFAALAAALVAAGLPVVLTGSAGEAELHRAILATVPQAHSLAGQGDLATLGGVLQACACLVVGDSGPMHLARAVGTPVVSLFGCTDSRQFDFTGHRLVRAPVPPDCAPCTFHGRSACPRGHLRCLNDIEVDQVLAAVHQVLAKPGRRAPVLG